MSSIPVPPTEPGPTLVLASSSPRRRELLGRLGIPFVVRAPDIDETPRPVERAIDYVERLAREKAIEAQQRAVDADEVIVAADTTVDIDGDIVGKPADVAEAVATLTRLSDRSHQVHTGVAVVRGERVVSTVTTSTVTIRSLSAQAIDDYVASGEPFDKAGGYGHRSLGPTLVSTVDGSVSNVIGLPMAQTEALLAMVGFDPVRWGPPRPD
jgi:septum formation protein